MRFVLSLLLGFAASGIGVIPPGLLNMTAWRIYLSEGKNAAKVFVLGAVLVITAECYLSILFARYLGKHPEVVLMLREAALVVFLSLSAYFFFFARKQIDNDESEKIHNKSSRFFLGVLLSGLNFLTVPFYVAVSLGLASYGVFEFEHWYIVAFVCGVLFGSSFGFYCFVTGFNKMDRYTSRIIGNMNKVIGGILLLLSALTLVNILQYYYG